MVKARDLKKKVELIMLIFGKDAKVKEVIQTIHG